MSTILAEESHAQEGIPPQKVTKASPLSVATIPGALAIRRYIAFVNDTSGITKIYIAKADGSSRRQFTYGYQPDWQCLS